MRRIMFPTRMTNVTLTIFLSIFVVVIIVIVLVMVAVVAIVELSTLNALTLSIVLQKISI